MRFLMVISFLGITANVIQAEDFLDNSFNECVNAQSWSLCFKEQFLAYLDDKLGTFTEAKSLENIDEALVTRAFKYLKSFDYSVNLPFIDGQLRYRPARSLTDLDVKFNNNKKATSEARGILKKKLLLPFLLLLKLKLKALMPIFVTIIGFKAVKALFLSKLAILLVVGFIAVQFLKKGGMASPMGVVMESSSMYGVPPVTTTTSGYEPVNTWDGNGPYSRIWSPVNAPEAQNLAYNYYSNNNSNRYGTSSISSSSSASSSATGSSSTSTNF